jgi:hypothetical protein
MYIFVNLVKTYAFVEELRPVLGGLLWMTVGRLSCYLGDYMNQNNLIV